jgi:preprotein translocase subunit YajC
LSLVIPLGLIVVLFFFSARARRRQATAEATRTERIAVGTEVMTTSGLHGTVVSKNSDGTVQLSIAPGVEVRWELAALRDVASLPDRYRRGASDGGTMSDGGGSANGTGGTSATPGTSGVQLSKED